MDTPVTGVVLAGGLSRRMGTDKRRLRLWGAEGPTLLEHTVQVVGQVCNEVIVVLNDASDWPDLPGHHVPDQYPDGGALGGIYTGLAAANHQYALVVAADMPRLNLALLRAMLSLPRDYDALLPRSEAGSARNRLNVEPLHAIYCRTCLPAIGATLAAGERKIAAFFPQVRVAYLEPAFIARYDAAGDSFRNVNTPEELARLGDSEQKL